MQHSLLSTSQNGGECGPCSITFSVRKSSLSKTTLFPKVLFLNLPFQPLYPKCDEKFMCIIIFDYMVHIVGKRTVETELNNINHQKRINHFSIRFLVWGAESIYSNCAGPGLCCNLS